MLPKLTSTVHTHHTLDGKVIHFRPFKSGDEQILLEAKESQDTNVIIQTVLDVIQSTIINKVNIKKLPSFEVENLLTKLRVVSVGETVSPGIRCEECETINKVDINLSEVKFSDPPVDNKIRIGLSENNEDVYVNMKFPTFADLEKMQSKKEENIIRTCIESIQIGDENIINLSDVTDEELNAWLNDMEKDKLLSIYEYINKIPKMHADIHFNCSKCNHENKIHLEGFEDFFI